MKISELKGLLDSKNQDDEVEFIIAKQDGEIVSVDVSSQAKAMSDFLKMFIRKY